MPDPLELIAISLKCLAAGLLLRSLEVLVNGRELRAGRLLGSWPRTAAAGSLARLEESVSGFGIALAVVTGRVAASAFALVMSLDHAVMPWAVGFLFASQLYVNRRLRRIFHAADVMFTYLLAAVFVVLIAPGETGVPAVALGFVGAQAALAYLTAALVKARSAYWRSGTALVAIWRGGAYAVPAISRLLTAWPRLSAAMVWAVMGLEMALAAAVVLPTPVFYAVLGLGVGFHLSIAVTLGLHSFLWSFLAAYPGLYFIHHWLAQRL
jgi:hypothetical protein